jgi:hypothetical protein
MAFLAGEAQGGAKPSTLGRRVAAIRYAHKCEPASNFGSDSILVQVSGTGGRETIDMLRDFDVAAVFLMVRALRRPQTPNSNARSLTYGLAIDPACSKIESEPLLRAD